MTQPANELQYGTFTVRRGSSARYAASLVTEDGETELPSGTLTTLKLTLRDAATGTVINDRNQQNILNTNGVTVDGDGLLTWTMEPDDNPIVGTVLNGKYEHHTALFEWTWDSGNKAGSWLVNIRVQQLGATA